MPLPAYQSPSVGELRRFGLVTGALLVLLFALLPLSRHRPAHAWAWLAGGALIALGLAAPQSLARLHRGWILVGHALGWINLRLILIAVFFLILTPLALLLRLFGHDALGGAAVDGSYRRKSTAPARERLERPY
jgi:hypothetical protein